MQGGDIAAELPRRVLAVWEDTLAVLPDGARRLTTRRRQVRSWQEVPLAQGKLWLLTSRMGVRVNVVTYLGHHFAHALEERLDGEGWPVHGYVAVYPNAGALGRALAGRRDIVGVLDSDKSRALHYGSRWMEL